MKLNGKACSGFLNCEIISDNKCLQCSQGYSLNGGICVETRSQCQSKSATGLCNKCIANFTLNGFTCCNLTMIPPFCSLLDSKRGLCLICNEGYELYHQYCQRKDYLPFFQRASLSGPQIQSALAMSTDILSNSDTITNNISPFKADFISQDYTDIEIKAQIGIGKINKK